MNLNLDSKINIGDSICTGPDTSCELSGSLYYCVNRDYGEFDWGKDGNNGPKAKCSGETNKVERTCDNCSKDFKCNKKTNKCEIKQRYCTSKNWKEKCYPDTEYCHTKTGRCLIRQKYCYDNKLECGPDTACVYHLTAYRKYCKYKD